VHILYYIRFFAMQNPHTPHRHHRYHDQVKTTKQETHLIPLRDTLEADARETKTKLKQQQTKCEEAFHIWNSCVMGP
jgi:hypothetical protein